MSELTEAGSQPPTLSELDVVARAATMDAEPEAIQLLDSLIVMMNQGAVPLAAAGHDRGPNFVLALIVSRAFNTLWRARESMVCGSYVPAMILGRSAIDDWITMEWIEADPERADLFLSEIIPEIEHPKDDRERDVWVASEGQMLSDLDQRGTDTDATHELLSKFTHVRGRSLKWQYDVEGDVVAIRAGSRFNANDLNEVLPFLIRTAAGFLPTIERLQIRWLGESEDVWVEAANEKVQAAIRYVESAWPAD